MSHLLFAAHDPGGANMLLPVIALARSHGYRISLAADGPARRIWRPLIDGGDDAVLSVAPASAFEPERPDLLVTGTSFCAFERALWAEAHRRGIKSVAAIDAWTSLHRRFGGDGDRDQPDVICVVDGPMRDEIAGGGWCRARLHVTGHPHLQSVAGHLRKERTQRTAVADLPVAAFFSEPVRQDHGGIPEVGYDQFSIAEAILAAPGGRDRMVLLIQPHPRENRDDWRAWLAETPLPEGVTILIGDEGAESVLCRCDAVIGIHSMVLIEAALADIPVLAVQLARKRKINPVLETVFGVPAVTGEGELAGALAGCLGASERPPRDIRHLRAIIDCADERMLAAIRDELDGKR